MGHERSNPLLCVRDVAEWPASVPGPPERKDAQEESKASSTVPRSGSGVEEHGTVHGGEVSKGAKVSRKSGPPKGRRLFGQEDSA